MSSPRRKLFGLLAVLVLGASLGLPGSAGLVRAQDGTVSLERHMLAPSAETGDLWFVELASAPASKGTSRARLQQEKAAFRAEARARGINFTERYAFDTLWNGLSVKADRARASRLSRIPGVTAVFPVLPATFEPTASASPEMATALAMSGADVAQSELGLTGAGIRVAVMDTGVDYNHPDLGGSGVNNETQDFPNSRVIAGHDFVGDDYDGSNPDKTTPAPDAYPDDCNGHGTHVAGIIGASPAADGGVQGVAPGVTFGAYRVFGCEGSTSADIMIAAMERALADEMHILNMSIGSAFMTWPQYPTAAAADVLVDQGMVVVASIGNSGANGVYSAGAPGVGRNVIGVASLDNTHVNALTFRVNPSDRQVPYLMLTTTPDAPTSGTTPAVVYVGRGCGVDPGYTTVEDPYLADPKDSVALIDRGACTFNSKYQRAVDAGAVAVVVTNNVAGIFAGGAITDRGVSAIGISKEDGDAIKALLGSQAVTLTWTNDRVNAANPTSGLASSFTSYGLTAELDLKPDIAAPGGLIRSTYPLEKDGYAILSGTSMASPHVAGTAALFLEARPDTSTLALRTILQNSADPVLYAAGLPYLQAVHRVGAGMVDIDDAILSTAVVEPGKIALGEGTGGTRTLTIRNNGTSSVTYALSHQGAVSTGGATNAPGLYLAHQTASFSASSVTVPAGGSATVDVAISAAVAQGRQYGGYIRLNGSDGSTFRVPYAGFSGDYQAIQVLTSGGCSLSGKPALPALAKTGGSTACDQVGGKEVAPIAGYTIQGEGATYTMKNADVPVFLMHFEHQARRLEMQLLDAATGKPAAQRGNARFDATFLAEDYMARNSTAAGFYFVEWYGALELHTPAGVRYVPQPDGQYKVKISVLKALGDSSNPDHWETWTSPAFTIDRP